MHNHASIHTNNIRFLSYLTYCLEQTEQLVNIFVVVRIQRIILFEQHILLAHFHLLQLNSTRFTYIYHNKILISNKFTETKFDENEIRTKAVSQFPGLSSSPLYFIRFVVAPNMPTLSSNSKYTQEASTTVSTNAFVCDQATY